MNNSFLHFEKKEQLFNNFQIIADSTGTIKANKDGTFATAGIFGKIWENLKAAFGRSNQIDMAGYQLCLELKYGAEKGWIKFADIPLIEKVVGRILKQDSKRDHTALVKLVEMISDVSIHPPTSLTSEYLQNSNNFYDRCVTVYKEKYLRVLEPKSFVKKLWSTQKTSAKVCDDLVLPRLERAKIEILTLPPITVPPVLENLLKIEKKEEEPQPEILHSDTESLDSTVHVEEVNQTVIEQPQPSIVEEKKTNYWKWVAVAGLTALGIGAGYLLYRYFNMESVPDLPEGPTCLATDAPTPPALTNVCWLRSPEPIGPMPKVAFCENVRQSVLNQNSFPPNLSSDTCLNPTYTSAPSLPEESSCLAPALTNVCWWRSPEPIGCMPRREFCENVRQSLINDNSCPAPYVTPKLRVDSDLTSSGMSPKVYQNQTFEVQAFASTTLPPDFSLANLDDISSSIEEPFTIAATLSNQVAVYAPPLSFEKFYKSEPFLLPTPLPNNSSEVIKSFTVVKEQLEVISPANIEASFSISESTISNSTSFIDLHAAARQTAQTAWAVAKFSSNLAWSFAKETSQVFRESTVLNFIAESTALRSFTAIVIGLVGYSRLREEAKRKQRDLQIELSRKRAGAINAGITGLHNFDEREFQNKEDEIKRELNNQMLDQDMFALIEKFGERTKWHSAYAAYEKKYQLKHVN